MTIKLQSEKNKTKRERMKSNVKTYIYASRNGIMVPALMYYCILYNILGFFVCVCVCVLVLNDDLIIFIIILGVGVLLFICLFPYY